MNLNIFFNIMLEKINRAEINLYVDKITSNVPHIDKTGANRL